MRPLLLVAAMCASPVALLAQGPPVLPSDLLVPALVEAEGRLGARFATEVALANLSAEPLELEALLLDGSGARAALQLSPHTTRALASRDLFTALGSPGGAAPLRLRVTRGAPDALVASARVFNTVAGGGTYGLSFPVAPAGASVLPTGETATVLGGSAERSSRLNVSLFAPFEPASATVEVLDALGVPHRSWEVSLDGLQRTQLDDVLAGVPAPGRALVTVRGGRVQIYGTVISNSATNDPYRSPALPKTGLATRWVVPAVASAPGRNGAVFSSDVFLQEGSFTRDFFIPLDVEFRPQEGPARTARLNLLPGTIRVVHDVVRELFPETVPSAGALVVSNQFFAVQVFAVTRSEPETGPSSQDLPCVAAGQEITASAPAAFVGVAETPGARSNLVLANVGPATRVSLRLFGHDGPRGTHEVALAEGQVLQLNSVALLFGGEESPAATLTVAPAAGGTVVASVARIDNRSNDPAGLAPVALPAALPQTVAHTRPQASCTTSTRRSPRGPAFGPATRNDRLGGPASAGAGPAKTRCRRMSSTIAERTGGSTTTVP